MFNRYHTFPTRIRDISSFYNLEDIYNMNEIDYFWKMILNKSLNIERVSD